MKNEIQAYTKGFYTQKAIEKAITDYKRIAKIKLTENDTHYICEFINCAIDTNRVMGEFSNYLIEILNTRYEVADT